MPVIQCPIADCTYATDDVEASIAAALMVIHNNVHVSVQRADNTSTRQRAPTMIRPKISTGSPEETWNTFNTRWTMLKRGTALTAINTVQQLFQCCDDDLGDAILRGNPTAADGTESQLLAAIKQMAVIPIAVSVRRAEFLATKQDHGENVRAFYAKVRGKANTCSYSITCSSDTCNQVIDFTDIMVKDVVVAGLADEEIKEVLEWSDLDDNNLAGTVTFIEAKEMAREALATKPINAGLSSYKAKTKQDSKPKSKVLCKECRVEMDKYVWNKRQG